MSQRTETLRQFHEAIARQVQPADVLGESELLGDGVQLVVGEVEAGHALEVVDAGRQVRQLVVRHVQMVDLRNFHLGRRELLELVVRQVQSDRQLVHVLGVPLDRVVRQVDLQTRPKCR